MSLFKKYTCSECSRKVSSIAKQLGNNFCLCSDCAEILSTFGPKAYVSYNRYVKIKEYQQNYFAKYRQLFHETHSYKNIHMDAKGLLFYIGDSITHNTIFLPFCYVDRCECTYSVSPSSTPFLGSVACKVSIYIKMKNPDITYSYTLHDQAKATFEDSQRHSDWFGDDYYVNTYSYDWPSSLKTFLGHFFYACKRTGGMYLDDGDGFDEHRFTYDSSLNDDWLSEWKKDLEEDKKRELNKPTYPQIPQINKKETLPFDSKSRIPVAAKSSALTADEYAEVMEFLRNQEPQVERDDKGT